MSITESTSVEKSRYAETEIIVNAQTELPALLFTDPYFDKKNGVWQICAYINKNQAAGICAAELDTGLSSVNAQLSSFDGKNYSFMQLKRLSSVNTSLLKLEKTCTVLTVLDTEKGKTYFSAIGALQNTALQIEAKIKPHLIFSIKIENDFENIITTAVQEVLENEGFILGQKARFIIEGKVTAAESSNAAGFFVKPSISLQVINTKTGMSESSYSKKYGKWGHKDKESALRKAFVEVEKDLQDNLSGIFR